MPYALPQATNPPRSGPLGLKDRGGQRLNLVGVLAGGFDDRLPAGDFAFKLGLQRCRGGVGFARRYRAEFAEAGNDVRILESHLQRLRQPLVDFGRRALRRINTVPDADLQPRKAAFRCRRQVREDLETFRRSDGIGLDRAALDLLGGVGGLVAHDVDLTAEQIGHCRTGAFVGNGGRAAFRWRS